MNAAAVVTRFAPSPSGELHLGNVRTALFNLLLTRRLGGRFLLRIEDTDAARTTDAHIAALEGDLTWLGLDWDEGPRRDGGTGPYRQSQRGGLYAPLLAQLESRSAAYACFCSSQELELSRRAQLAAGRPPRYAGTCAQLDAREVARRFAAGATATLRFRVPGDRQLVFDDLVHGPQQVDCAHIGDFVIRREDGTPAFFFANAVDDSLMGVTHALRGEDHLANTPRQLLVLEALGMRAPRYGHLPLLIGADGTPLSKRTGAQSLRELREAGYSATAICNHLFRLGHSSGEPALLTLAEMATHFETSHLQRASARFDPVQLRHWQGLWAHALKPAAALAWLEPFLPATATPGQRTACVAALQPNLVAASDIVEWLPVVFGGELRWEDPARAAVAAAGKEFYRLTATAAAQGADLGAWRAASGRTGAAFFAPLRAALTGRLHGPELGALLKAMSPGLARERLVAWAH
ncbi:MAG TPA: glutamate--tRNA ligase [Steroidobacteraceae bacterium]|nr:glutamate--tRNA ligase [Steroidobacteraceae bacterium]